MNAWQENKHVKKEVTGDDHGGMGGGVLGGWCNTNSRGGSEVLPTDW